MALGASDHAYIPALVATSQDTLSNVIAHNQRGVVEKLQGPARSKISRDVLLSKDSGLLSAKPFAYRERQSMCTR